MACIVYSAITALRYQYWGIELLTFDKIFYNSDYPSGKWWFLKKDDKLKYTKQENDALAVLGIIIVLSVIEIILAAALAKVSDSSHKVAQPAIPIYAMYHQVRMSLSNHTMKQTCSLFVYHVQLCLELHANGRNNSQQCYDLQCIVGRLQPIRLWRPCVMRVRGPNNVGRAVQTDPINIVALRFGDHVTKGMLGVVGSNVFPVSNFAQQLPMQQGVQTDATRRFKCP